MNAQTGGYVPAGIVGVSLTDRFAEALAELGCIETASAAVRITPEHGEQLFQRMCKRLGRQAA